MSSEKKPETSGSDSDVKVPPPFDDHLPPSTGDILGSVEPHVFTNPYRAAYWKDIYDGATYEGRHRFDPSWSWSLGEESRLKKKVRRSKISLPVLLSVTKVTQTRVNAPFILTDIVMYPVARLESHGLGLGHVFKSRSRSPQHQSRRLR